MITLNKQQALSIASLLAVAANPKHHDAFAHVYIEFDPAKSLVRAVATDKYCFAQVSFELQPLATQTEKFYAVLAKTDITNLKDLTKIKQTTPKFVITNETMSNGVSTHNLSFAYETTDDLPSIHSAIFVQIGDSMLNMKPETENENRPIELSLTRLAQLTKLVPPVVVERKADDVFSMRHVGFSANRKALPLVFERPGIVAMIQPMLSAN
jgi:hypothetical protein